MSIRVLVVDDERLARMGIAARLKRQPDIEIIGQCATGEQAVSAMRTEKPDLVFLDIEMPGMSGLQVLRATEISSRPAVVFLTAHRQYALQAFELQVLDYLLKPINDDRFLACIERVKEFSRLRSLGASNGSIYAETTSKVPAKYLRRFVLRYGDRVMFVTTAEIDWIEGVGDYMSAIRTTLRGRRWLDLRCSLIRPSSYGFTVQRLSG